MFTGIITHTGVVVPPWGRGRLFIRPTKKISGVKRGESVAVNGCCLTVTAYKKNVLIFDVSAETLRVTALGQYHQDMVVNLERTLKMEDRLGGHFVLGHIDGVGKILAIKKSRGSWRLTITYANKFSHLLVEKGSVAVDGISLTVCALTPTQFDAHIIPHTWENTHLKGLHPGHPVNLEFDVLGKYVKNLVLRKPLSY